MTDRCVDCGRKHSASSHGAAAPDAGLREALERMVNQWAPDATNPALDNARAVLLRYTTEADIRAIYGAPVEVMDCPMCGHPFDRATGEPIERYKVGSDDPE